MKILKDYKTKQERQQSLKHAMGGKQLALLNAVTAQTKSSRRGAIGVARFVAKQRIRRARRHALQHASEIQMAALAQRLIAACKSDDQERIIEILVQVDAMYDPSHFVEYRRAECPRGASNEVFKAIYF